jgi:ankyrin repeat protein
MMQFIVANAYSHQSDDCKDGYAALILASERGHLAVVEALLNHGASVDEKNEVRMMRLII